MGLSPKMYCGLINREELASIYLLIFQNSKIRKITTQHIKGQLNEYLYRRSQISEMYFYWPISSFIQIKKFLLASKYPMVITFASNTNIYRQYNNQTKGLIISIIDLYNIIVNELTFATRNIFPEINDYPLKTITIGIYNSWLKHRKSNHAKYLDNTRLSSHKSKRVDTGCSLSISGEEDERTI